MRWFYTAQTVGLAWCLVFGAGASFAQEQDPPPPPEPPQAAQQSPEQLQQLVAPIALYPDSMIAQILPAATYPDQILEAAKFLDQNRGLQGPQLAQQVVSSQGPDIEIQPASPDTVYVPEYDPWLAYGPPLAPWPGWYPYPGLYLNGPGFAFGVGFPIGFYGGYGWGWNHWRYNWRGGGRVEFGRRPYISHSNVIVNRGGFGGGVRNLDRGRDGFRGTPNPGFRGAGTNLARPAPNVRPNEGMRSGAFSGVRPGGDMRGAASRGRASFGGGAPRGGGGAPRGGGGHR